MIRPNRLAYWAVSLPLVLWPFGFDELSWAFLSIPLILAFASQRPLWTRFTRVRCLGAALFLTSAVIGAFWISNPIRYLDFFRELGLLCSCGLLFFAVSVGIRANEAGAVLRFLLITYGSVTLMTLLSLPIVGVGVLSTTASYLIPHSLIHHTYVSHLVDKQLWSPAWFAGESCYRFKGIWNYATSAAVIQSVMAVTCITQVGMGALGRKLSYLLFGVFLLGAAATLTRMAGVALAAGVATTILVDRPGPAAYRLGAAVILGWILVAGCLIFISPVIHAVTMILTARGGGSLNTRIQIYGLTWNRIVAWPFGWGAYRDVPGVPFPLGSHSSYLSLLFKYGVGGVLGILVYGIDVIKTLRRYGRAYGPYVIGVTTVVLVFGITQEWYLDSKVFLVMTVICALIYGSVPVNGQMVGNYANQEQDGTMRDA